MRRVIRTAYAAILMLMMGVAAIGGLWVLAKALKWTGIFLEGIIDLIF